MPIFEYKCNHCNKNFELLVRSDTKIRCDKCGNENVKKLFSSFVVNKHNKTQQPSCTTTCPGGFEKGSCGSGFCGSKN